MERRVEDVTALLGRYRECARTVWNEFLRETATFENEVLCRFEQIQRILFQAIVLDVIGMRQYLKPDADQPYSFLRVVPNAATIPIMIERPSAENRYWDDPIDRVEREAIDLRFIDYFDWDQLAKRSFLYYRVQIAGYSRYPQVVGRQALVEVGRARVFLDRDAPRGGPSEVA